MNKKPIKKYADLMHQAQQATGRKEAVGLIHKAAKLKSKFNSLTYKNFTFYLRILNNHAI